MSEQEVKKDEGSVEEPERNITAGELKTDTFKVHLQGIIKDRLGEKVSKETAWNLFKDVINGTVQYVACQEDKHLSLSGIGRFEVIKVMARGLKKEAGKTHSPKFRFYPSSSIEKFVDSAMGQTEIADDVKGLGLYSQEDYIST